MNQVFHNNVIGSVNGPNYGTVTSDGIPHTGRFLDFKGEHATAHCGTETVAAAAIKVVAVDADGNELQSYQLPTGTSVKIDISVENDTNVSTILCHNASVSIDGATWIKSIQCTNGSVDITNTNTVNKLEVVNGDANIKAKKIGDVFVHNGSVKKR